MKRIIKITYFVLPVLLGLAYAALPADGDVLTESALGLGLMAWLMNLVAKYANKDPLQ